MQPLVAPDRAAAEAGGRPGARRGRRGRRARRRRRGPRRGPGPGRSRTALAVLPAGTGNDLALALGVPADPLEALDAALADLSAGTGRAVDLARSSSAAGERWWATVLCCGFDSAVSDRVNRLRWPPGPRRYDLAIALELARLRPRAVRITVDGVAAEHDVTLVAVGNTGWYGGGLRICPGADPADGLLDLTVVGPVSRLELVRTRRGWPPVPTSTTPRCACCGAGRCCSRASSRRPPGPTASRSGRCRCARSSCPPRSPWSAPAAAEPPLSVVARNVGPCSTPATSAPPSGTRPPAAAGATRCCRSSCSTSASPSTPSSRRPARRSRAAPGCWCAPPPAPEDGRGRVRRPQGPGRGRKAFYTTPIKALSNQKYADLVDRYGAERVGLLTGDNAVNGDARWWS